MMESEWDDCVACHVVCVCVSIYVSVHMSLIPACAFLFEHARFGNHLGVLKMTLDLWCQSSGSGVHISKERHCFWVRMLT